MCELDGERKCKTALFYYFETHFAEETMTKKQKQTNIKTHFHLI